MGYMGIGRNANAEKRYNDAIEQFDYVTRLASNYSSGYSFRAESYIGINQFNKAIDDIIRALNIDGNDKAFNLMFQVADSSMVELVTKLKVQSIKSPNNDYWPYCLGVVHEHSGAYSKAIDYYISSMEKDCSPITANRISNCYSEIGNFTLALEYIDEAIVMDSTNYDF